MGVRDRIAGLFRIDPSISQIDPYRRAGADAYGLLDDTPRESWARLAAWNAFLLQVYADSILKTCSSGGYLPTDCYVFLRRVYEQANVWVEETRKAKASLNFRYEFQLPCPLPHWYSALRTDAELEGMRAALDTARTRAASELEAFAGEDPQRDLLRVRLAQIDAEITSIGQLWTPEPPEGLRGTIGDDLADALNHVYELGQLLAQPELFNQLL